MGSQTLSILRQGLWASLTGGWYYDPKQSHFSNVFHLYIWLLFLCLPFTIQLSVSSVPSWIAYCFTIGALFTVIKFTNAYLHRLFDYGECVIEESSSHKSDDEINIEDPNVIEEKDRTMPMINSEHRAEDIEMIVMGQCDNNGPPQRIDQRIDQRLDSVNNSNNNVMNNNGDYLERSICGANAASVIDLEVDVHHRNSSGSSIGVSSERIKNNTDNDHCAKIDNCSLNPNQTNSRCSETPNSLISPPTNTVSASNLTHECSDLSESCDTITKGASLELGFMAQDPSVMRAAANASHDQQSRGKRIDNNMVSVRRARSELETTQCSDKKVSSSLPPSHPQSLEMIGSGHNPDNDSNGEQTCDPKQSHSEVFHRTTASLSDNIKPIDELNADDSQCSSTIAINENTTPDGTTVNTSPVLSDHRTQSISKRDESQQTSNSVSPRIRLSDDDEGDESDISLVVNYASKNKKRKTTKGAKRRALSRKRVSKSTSSGKIHSLNRKTSDKLGTSDVSDLSKRCAVHYSSDSDIESDNESDSYSSSSKSSVSLSSSHTSADEKTPLTSFINNPNNSGDIEDRSLSLKNAPMSLEPKCVAGPSKSPTYESELSKKIFDILSKNDSAECELELRRLRSELQNWRKKQTRAKSSSVTHSSRGHIDTNEQQLQGSPSTALESSPGMVMTENGPPPYLLARILSVPGTHLARSHEDTTPGAVHVFQDERGNWLTYTFDENSTGVARGLMNSDKALMDFDIYTSLHRQSGTSSSGSTVILDTPNVLHTPKMQFVDPSIDYSRIIQPNANTLFAESFPITAFPRIRTNRRFELNTSMLFNQHHSGSVLNGANISDLYPMRFADFSSPEQPHKPKQYYKLWVLPFKHIKVRFDRLTLLALLDRSLTKFELIMSIVLALLVSVFGAILLYKEFFHDLSLFAFCFVISSSQYTLLKSVQPDAASPTHGYNRVTLYSRPIYFCLSCLLLLLSHNYMNSPNRNLSFVIYGRDILSDRVIEFVRDANFAFLLSFPILFSFGLLPQITTFLMYIFEQIDVHVFGGTAVIGLISSVYSILRSIICVGLLYAFALVALREPPNTQNVTFSVFCGLLIATCYILSRTSSDPSIYWNLIKRCFICKKTKHKICELNTQKALPEQQPINDRDDVEDVHDEEITDPLPAKLEQTVVTRLQSDMIICVFIVIVIFATHVSTIFTLQPYVEICIGSWAIIWGFLLHYFMSHFRKQLPWLCFAHPVLKPKEYNQFEVKDEAKLMWFENVRAWFWLIEKNVIYPLVFLSAISNDAPKILNKFGFHIGTLIVVICGFKCVRSTFSDCSHNYIVLLFTYLFFTFDLASIAEPFLLNYFVLSIAYFKVYELLLKVRFILTYIAPWQITWGSAFHAFAQPFSVPHSGMLFVQALISSLLSAPLQPLLGSAIFFASYVRPIKFWERDYNTKRVDHSNTRLASQLERAQLGADDNNLNSIFYEHLTRSLQHSLYGDLILGRWGPVSQGDCFVLASDNLNCLVHIIELGNGLVTFQVRGLEFRGTYCQQREVEAISEGVSEDEGCCCCEPGHIPGMLSLNAAFNQRGLAWEVTHIKYVLEGYSISDNSAVTMLQPYDLRKALITYYIKSIIYFCVTSKSLEKWIQQPEIISALECMKDPNYVDLDPIFNASVDEDFDFRSSGISKSSFCHVYLEWIQYCIEARNKDNKLELDTDKEATIVSLCCCLSLLARRALSAASHHNSFSSVEFLLYGLHALFKGDFRITSSRDEWVFQDMNLLRNVIAPSVRMALKLHQDHFMSTEEYDDNATLYYAINGYQKNLIISHEADPVWRNAVLSNVPSLLALRHVFDDGTDQYKIIMLNKRYLSFRVIKINRECVRGLWAGQQQELVYLRNRNPERGSIQNAKQALRNIINSSCDQPIGYPIYVSPLTTSFAETNAQLCKVIGSPLSFAMFKRAFMHCWHRLRTRCGEGCSSGGMHTDLNEITTGPCHRIESFPFERGGSNRGSNFSETSQTEYDSNQYLCRRSRTQPHPYAYHRQYRYADSKSNTRHATTLVNLNAFRPNVQTPSGDLELDTMLLHKNSRTHSSKGEPV